MPGAGADVPRRPGGPGAGADVPGEPGSAAVS